MYFYHTEINESVATYLTEIDKHKRKQLLVFLLALIDLIHHSTILIVSKFNVFQSIAPFEKLFYLLKL